MTKLLTGSVLTTLVYSLTTRYGLGALKLLSMPTHLALDRASGFVLCAASLTTNSILAPEA